MSGQLIARTLKVLREQGVPEVRRRIIERVCCTHVSYGLCCELGQPRLDRPCHFPLRLRPLVQSDVASLFDAQALARERYLVEERLELISSGVGRCYVATTAENHPCFMIWMATGAEKAQVLKTFGRAFPELQPGEALLDGLFVPKRFEGSNVVPGALAELKVLARHEGLHRLFVFVHRSRPAAVFALRQSGFLPHCVKVDRRRLLFRSVTLRPISDRDFGAATSRVTRWALFAESAPPAPSP